MKIDLRNTRIFIKPGPTDLRTSLDSLIWYVQYTLKQDPLNGSIFLFCNRTRNILKAITFDKTGFWIAQKKLQKSTWKWPGTLSEINEINTKQLMTLLNGKDLTKIHR